MTVEQHMDDFERSLIASTKDDGPSDAARTAALGAMIAASSTTGAASPKVHASLAAKWILLGTLITAVVAVIVVRRSVRPNAMGPAVSAPAASNVPASSEEAPLAAPPPIPLVAVSDLPRAQVPAAPPAPQGPVKSSPEPDTGMEPDRLAEEVRTLALAQQAAKAGDNARALEALMTYEAMFPSGKLADEAAALRISVEARSGQRQVAIAHAEQFLVDHASSADVPRVRRILEDLKK